MKRSTNLYRLLSGLAGFLVVLSGSANGGQVPVQLNVVGSYSSGIFGQSAAEIVAHDPVTQRLFVVNAANSSIDVLQLSAEGVPSFLFAIDVSRYGDQANSVDVCNGLVAAAVQADIKTNRGTVEFFDAFGNHLRSVGAGSLPDMLTFTEGCEKLLVANEGEPNSYNRRDSVDPEGSVTIVDLRNGLGSATVTQAGFKRFNNTVLDPAIRIFGPNANVAQDLEPEYIAVDRNSEYAWVTLQENNAIGVLDLQRGQFVGLKALGYKDHNLAENKFDASDRDVPGSSNNGILNIRNWPVYGMYQPDGIASFEANGKTYFVTANEGDARDWPGFAEEARIGSLTLDAAAFAARGYADVTTGAAGLRNNDNLGRLNVTSTRGNLDSDAEFEELYSFGARSFSIWDEDGNQVFDSGDQFEQITASLFPDYFNFSNDDNNFDSRSDNKGPEPEAIVTAEVYGRTYAFIGLERIGGIMVFDVTDPLNVSFATYKNNRNFTAPVNSAAALDLGPEGLHFVAANDSPTGVPMIVAANEVSGTTTVYEFRLSTPGR